MVRILTNITIFLCIGLSVSNESSMDYEVAASLQPDVVGEDANDTRSNDLDWPNQITPSMLDEIFQSAQSAVEERKQLEREWSRSGRVTRSKDGKIKGYLFRKKRSDPEFQAREELHMPFEYATEEMIDRYNLTAEEVEDFLPQLPFSSELQRRSVDPCRPEPLNCDGNVKYRTASGRCNNFHHPTWGMSMVCQQRMMHPSYVGQSGFRQSLSGGPLPGPRRLSINLHAHLNRPSSDLTHLYVFFGQLIDHDFALTPMSTTVDNEVIQCCPPTNPRHPQCAPILIGGDDPFYPQFGVNCLNFVRSAICPTCSMGHKRVIAQLTSFIDASFVYGSTEEETASLRAFDQRGRLRTQRNNFGDLLPRTADPRSDECSFPDTNDFCFVAGDERVNENTILASLHTIFMREHNRLADGLLLINPHWDEDELFQEARRILIAEVQAIVYRQYLPITLGNEMMSNFQLWVSDRGTTVYDPEADPTMFVEFTTAAFRFSHTLINSVLSETPLNSTNGLRLLRNDFFQPFDLYNGIIGSLMRGASDSPAQSYDRHVVPDLTNHLYRRRGERTGEDLASLNINRGRDHGLPPYIKMVRFCTDGRVNIQNYSDLARSNLIPREPLTVLRRNYREVGDIDLWPGIVMETPLEGAVIGPTAACIVGRQFNRLKFGDRFYFEHRNQAGSFTFEQLLELKQTTLSKIICLNTDANQLPENVMRFESRTNRIMSCRDVRPIDLSYWRE